MVDVSAFFLFFAVEILKLDSVWKLSQVITSRDIGTSFKIISPVFTSFSSPSSSSVSSRESGGNTLTSTSLSSESKLFDNCNASSDFRNLYTDLTQRGEIQEVKLFCFNS
ncbi:hypothetical protein TNCT_612841 [Trichonephila clavata]|uniref:Uncharacterized protein n=1 Tax=Trichonephila clavata TaxID=2740835 RepID=A0A8X6G9L8_TRICU|nr:hypothetical protein TNCT_612841 [Trichonephila clavata]